jgi:hypothetical protein
VEPVDEAAGRAIDALLTAALASVERDPVTGAGVNPGPTVAAFLDQVQADHGWAGIYRVAVGCARIATDGLGGNETDGRGQAPFVHFGSVGEEQPHTPVGYRVSRFVVALLRGDEASAWLEFLRWQPDDASPPSPEMRGALWDLLSRAWTRQAGRPLTWTIRPGDEWPPQCDFCCRATAKLMFRCRPFDMASPGEPGGMGGVVAVYSDVEFWYACRVCAGLVDADDWSGLWRRYTVAGPGSGNVRRLWEAFRRYRKPGTHRLPKSRPAPSVEVGGPTGG